jgi:hypothetical protein
MLSNNAGDLSRSVNHNPNDEWPILLELVAYFGPNKTKRRSLEISADEFFGRGVGAPMSGDVLIRKIEQLRRSKK